MKCLALSLLLLLSEALPAQILGETLVYEDFDAGIPASWESGITSANNIAHWEYRGPSTSPDISVGPRGSCSAGSVAIPSLTHDNGFVLFDSNYWDDNDNVCDGSDSGEDPGNHVAWLTTSSFDFSANSSLVLTFQQQYKHYQTTTTKVYVSTNDGGSWTEVTSNPGFFSPSVEWKTVNVSAFAGGQPSVRFKFEFSGSYYWWQVDDIAIYSPNPDDLQLSEAHYSNYGIVESPILFNDMEYDKYPLTMIPSLHFSGRATNIGGNTQTNAALQVVVKKNGTNQVYSGQSPAVTLSAGASTLLQLPVAYSTPAQLADYFVYYTLDQTEDDDNSVDNLDTLDYSVTPFSYARDEGSVEDVFVPGFAYQDDPIEIGNFFQARANNRQFHAIGVALGEGTTIGSSIYGVVYNYAMDSVFATSAPYIVNAWDINAPGEEKIISLPLETPILTKNDSLYLVMVVQSNGEDELRVARSGVPPAESSIVRYPDSNALFWLLKTPMVRMHLFSQNALPGCTNAAAMNYDASANTDDGSCRFPGCTLPQASNYDPVANWDDGSCIYIGCTNPEASNYDPGATIDDGSCLFAGCTDLNADNFDPNATQDDGSCLYSGCTDPTADNFDPQANADDGSCVYSGCTNPAADNFDPQATNDDGSCILSGCTDPNASNYDPQANNENGTCIYAGCTDPDASNYDPQAEVDDGSCLYPGCTDPLANNYDPDANSNDLSCIYSVAYLASLDTAGCVPFTMEIINQTEVGENGICTIELPDGSVISDCVPSFEYTLDVPGDYYFSYTYVQGLASSQFVLGPIHAYASPEIPEIFANGFDYSLACTGCDGTEVTWIYNGIIAATGIETDYSLVDNGLVQNGYYSVVITDDHGCTAESDSLLVLYSVLTVEDPTVCAGGEIEFAVGNTSLFGQTCSLDAGNSFITESCETSYSIQYDEPGVYSPTLTLFWNGFSAQSEPLEITVFPTPALPELVFDQVEGFIDCQNCGGTEVFVWFLDGDALTGLNSPAIAWQGDGDYSLLVINEFDCSILSDPLTVNTQGISMTDPNPWNVFPNPFGEWIFCVNPPGSRSIDLKDVAGRTILTAKAEIGVQEIQVHGLASGLYFISISTDGGRITIPILCQ